MKHYDFDTVIKRYGTGSYKWDEMTKVSNVGKDVIPFSVADMELVNPPEIIDGLKDFLNHSVLGYAQPTDAYINAVQNWILRRHNWKIEPEWIKDGPGVINAFFTAVKAFTKEGDGVMLMTPVYYPMYYAIERNNRVLVDNKLIVCGDHYEIDFDDFEQKAKDPNTKMLILCSPHNPTGRVWTNEELQRIGRICIDNNVIVVSDEIHNDIIMPGYKHTVFASICDDFAQNSITCTSPSKTFNIAGLQTANMIIPSKELRDIYWKEICTTEGNPKCNILGLEACRLAYEKCEEWLEQLIKLIDTNQKIVSDFVKKEFPQIKVFRLEGTYLLWMDFSELGIECRELSRILKEEAHLFFDDGYIFGEQGAGFERWNLACPTKYIYPALERLKTTLRRHI
ncbi:MAG: pyridoxal phosphate-dependent aminotransferase [Clostridiales bacterium]|nr:pyridoxal phosphate-dependent aminotransferase [Clostridiales bacterium]